MSIVAISYQGLKRSCISACPLGRQPANLFCLARAVVSFSKFKINIEDDLHGSLPIGQVSMKRYNLLPDKRSICLRWLDRTRQSPATPIYVTIPSTWTTTDTRQFLSCLNPLFQSKAKCKAIVIKMIFYSHANITTTWLAQLGECRSAEWEVVGSNPGRTNTQGL